MATEAPAYTPTLDEIKDNATAACAEIQRQIALQATESTAIDTKSSALFTLSLGLLAVAASRVHLDSPDRIVSGAVALALGLVLMACCALALRPRDGFAYGADPQSLVAVLEGFASYGVMLRMAQSLADARDGNREFIGVKQAWYERGLVGLIVLALALAFMVQTRAIR